MQKLFETERLCAFIVDELSAKLLLDYEKANREWFAQFSHTRNDRYYTLANFQYFCDKQVSLYEDGRKVPLVFSLKGRTAIVAQVSLSDIVYGSSYSAKLGYSTSEEWARQGLGTEAVRSVIEYAFGELNLHRLEVTIMARNYPSLAFAFALGFEHEGICRQYIHMHGKWEDYCFLALLNEQHQVGK